MASQSARGSCRPMRYRKAVGKACQLRGVHICLDPTGVFMAEVRYLRVNTGRILEIMFNVRGLLSFSVSQLISLGLGKLSKPVLRSCLSGDAWIHAWQGSMNLQLSMDKKLL